MVTRVSTYTQTQSMLRSLQKSNEGVNLTSYQITSGYKAQRLSDIASDAGQILNLRDLQAKSKIYVDNMTSVKNQLTAAESALQQMTDILSSALTLATTGRNESTAETRSTLVPEAQSLTESFYTLFKTEYNDRPLFSGSSDQPPVSGTGAATAYPGTPVPTTWYQGDSTLPSTVTGPGTTMSYGIAGDNEAFANLKAGLESLWYGLQNNNVTEIDNASSALNAAKSQLSSLLGQVGGQMSTADSVTTRQTNQQSFLTDQLDGLEKVDVSEALTRFSQEQATMEASMALITQVNQLSLLDYLK